MRDVFLYRTSDGLFRQIRACGDGIIDFSSVMSALFEHNPELNLSVECINRRNDNLIPIDDPRWRAADANLSVKKLQSLVETAVRPRPCGVAGPDCYFHAPVLSTEEQVDFIRRCHAHLRRCLPSG
jgi:hypothetical protein